MGPLRNANYWSAVPFAGLPTQVVNDKERYHAPVLTLVRSPPRIRNGGRPVLMLSFHLDVKRPTLSCDFRRVVRSQSAVYRLLQVGRFLMADQAAKWQALGQVSAMAMLRK